MFRNIVSSIRIDGNIANDTQDTDITNSLHGITTAQAYIYAYNSEGDSLTLKLAVAGLWWAISDTIVELRKEGL